ncbi:lysophospholipase [Geopyxis carbonaria]|nr:lysophospholipase [Geopyxis carbonaria]
MRIPSLLLTSASLLGAVAANPLPPALEARAFSDSPTGDYAPGEVACPSKPLLRTARNVSSGETAFLKARHVKTDAALSKFLKRAKLNNFDVDGFLDGYSPNVALAFSGGGYRAMLNGGGQLKGLDARTAGSEEAGHMGGLLQSSTYIAGLSGGSWLVGSMILNNYTTIQALQDSKDLWDLENSIVTPDGKLSALVDANDYYAELSQELSDKRDAGFEVSLTDLWGRALSRQFIGLPRGGPGVTFSSIADTDDFKQGNHPFPVVVADGRNPGETIISANATVYEFNPLEFGSFDPQLYSFTPVEYIGSNVTRGVPVKKNVCVRGFDNAGFIMGTSSSLFNIIAGQLQAYGIPDFLLDIADGALAGIASDNNDIADYSPNPFFGVNPRTNPSAKARDLTLVDGGLDLQNIPLHPLIQPARAVDVIFAFDNSADTLLPDGTATNWPNGTALIASYMRSLDPKISNGTRFPPVPDANTFLNAGLNNRPTFFGCAASNFSTPANAPPLLVYMPNAPWSFHSNTSTLDMSYPRDTRDAIIANGYNVATQGNSTAWVACAACAVVHREQERRGVAQSSQCKTCFEEYCWDGKRNSSEPATYEPAFKVKGTTSAGERGLASPAVALVVAVAVGFVGTFL